MQPDLVLVGDSHVAALHAAAEAQGLTAAMLFISGNRWHDNLIRTHPRKGLSADHRPRLAKRVNAFAGSLGGTAFPEGVPILASIGYHLGRLVPPLARYGHTPDAAQAGADPDRLPISGAFLDAYIDTHRSRLFRLLRLAGQRSDLTVIAPSIIQSDPSALHVAARITAILREKGLNVFDTREEADWRGRPLAAEYLCEDGVHANAAYGTEVLRRIGLTIPA